jgi:hypothetical protein
MGVCACSGTEVLVRFNNKIVADKNPNVELGEYPCLPKFNRPFGRPISIHLHGSASLPPYDGWADDVTCTGESKDYIYPNNRATTLWYHDHGFEVTAANAYYGTSVRCCTAPPCALLVNMLASSVTRSCQPGLNTHKLPKAAQSCLFDVHTCTLNAPRS